MCPSWWEWELSNGIWHACIGMSYTIGKPRISAFHLAGVHDRVFVYMVAASLIIITHPDIPWGLSRLKRFHGIMQLLWSGGIIIPSVKTEAWFRKEFTGIVHRLENPDTSNWQVGKGMWRGPQSHLISYCLKYETQEKNVFRCESFSVFWF